MSPVFAVVIENGDADLTAADIVSEDGEKYTFNYPIKSIKNSARGDKFAVGALLYF